MRKLLTLSLLGLALAAPSAHAWTWVDVTIKKLRPVNGRIWVYPNEDITSLLAQEEQEGCNPAYLNVPMFTLDASGTAAEKVSNMTANVLLYAAATQTTVRLKLIGCIATGGPNISDVTLLAVAQSHFLDRSLPGRTLRPRVDERSSPGPAASVRLTSAAIRPRSLPSSSEA